MGLVSSFPFNNPRSIAEPVETRIHFDGSLPKLLPILFTRFQSPSLEMKMIEFIFMLGLGLEILQVNIK